MLCHHKNHIVQCSSMVHGGCLHSMWKLHRCMFALQILPRPCYQRANTISVWLNMWLYLWTMSIVKTLSKQIRANMLILSYTHDKLQIFQIVEAQQTINIYLGNWNWDTWWIISTALLSHWLWKNVKFLFTGLCVTNTFWQTDSNRDIIRYHYLRQATSKT